MRVLQISNYYYPHIGGIEQVAGDIAKALSNIQDDNIMQRIICFNENASDGDFVNIRKETVREQVNGIEVIRCGCVTKKLSQSISFSYKKMLSREIKDFKPDVIIFHYPNPFVAHFLLGILKRVKKPIKLVLYWHLDITKQKLVGKLFNGQNRRLLNKSDIIVATSPNYIEGSPFLSEYKDKCIVIPNCVDQTRLKVTDESHNKALSIREQYKDKTLCFAVGRHVEYKGMEYLVEAANYMSSEVLVFIGGKGPLTDKLRLQADTVNSKGKCQVKILGRLNEEDLKAYYEACDIFCFPSITKNEAFGISLAEGMYYGKPAVTFTIEGSGVNYVSLDGVTGIECPNKDSMAMAGAIAKLRDNKLLATKYGDNAKNRVNELFLDEQFKVAIKELIYE